ncbi:MAG: hypothetical protein IPJ30_16650 [Acidobacteria bacterium]|nr:hypothetical protein [Acidobacteriota bacterium]
MHVFCLAKKSPPDYTPVTAPMRFDGASGRYYWLTPTSSEQYIAQDEPNPIIAPFLKGFSEAADDKIYGMGKGTYNFAAGAWNTAASGPVGLLLGVESPFSVGYYRYSNAREAGWSFATQAGLTISTAAFGGSAVPRGGSSIFGLTSETSAVTSGTIGGLTPASTEAIISRAATVGANRVIAPNARVEGTLSHSKATAFIDRYQSLFGNRGLETNFYVRGTNGRLGSSTFDVLDDQWDSL